MTKFGAEVFTVIVVIILLCYSEKCNSQSENEILSNIYKMPGLRHNFPGRPLHKLSLFKRNHHRLPLQPYPHRGRVQNLRKKLKKSEKAFFNTPHRVPQRRLVRQAYPDYRPALYPSLPTPPSNYNQSFANYIYQQNQTSYTPPYNPQWQPTSMQNYSQPGYPGYNTASNNNGFNNPGNPSNYNSNYPSYSSRPSGPVTPNPAQNPLFGQGHGHRYPYTSPTNYSNFGSQTPSSYPSYPGSTNINKRPSPGYSQSHVINNNTFTYNPSQRPPNDPSGNSAISSNTPKYQSYSTTQRYPVPFYNNTTQRTPYKYPNQIGPYNNSQSSSFNRPGIPAYTNGPYGAYNPGQNDPNHSFTGFPSTQLNSTVGSSSTHQTGFYNASFNGFLPNSPSVQYPSRRNDNNFTNSYNMNPNPGAGYNGQNNFAYSTDHSNQATYSPQAYNQQPGGGSYPKPQFNGTSTYRIANYYTPNIPNHPSRNDNNGQHNSFYPSNAIHDPARVPPERFSY